MRYKKKWMAFLAAVLVFAGSQTTGLDVKAAEPVLTPAYTAEIHEDQTITAGKTVTLTVEMGPNTETVNSLDMRVSYDSEYLSFENELSSNTNTNTTGCSFTEVTGGVDVTRYGAKIDLATDNQVCKLVFKAKKAGTTTVSITSMNADLDTNAATGDAPDVKIIQKDAVLTIQPAPQTNPGSNPGSNQGSNNNSSGGKHHHKSGSSSDSTPAASSTAASTPASGVASPQTGDTAMPILWAALIVAAAVAIVLLLHKRKQYLHK